jgi:antitoxin (DNA-binding transcriptional repressor) of toxin-antitoxin stability system
MAVVVPVSEAKTRLTELLRLVEDDEQVLITRNGRVVAELRRCGHPDRTAAFGAFAGEVAGDLFGPVSEFEGWESGPPGAA